MDCLRSNSGIFCPDSDGEGHLQVRYVCQRPAADRERPRYPDDRGQSYFWRFPFQVQVGEWKQMVRLGGAGVSSDAHLCPPPTSAWTS